MGFFKDEFSMSEMDEERFGHCINHGVYYGDYNGHCPMCKIAELAGFIKKLKPLVKCSKFPCTQSYGMDCKGFDFDCNDYNLLKF